MKIILHLYAECMPLKLASCVFFTPFMKTNFFAFKDFFLENFILIYDLFKSGF